MKRDEKCSMFNSIEHSHYKAKLRHILDSFLLIRLD